MKQKLILTAEQLAYVEANYKPGIPGKGAAATARALGISRDGLLRNINPDYRRKRNASALRCWERNGQSRARPRPPITLACHAYLAQEVRRAAG